MVKMHVISYLLLVSGLCYGDKTEPFSVTFKKTVQSDCNCTEYNRSFQKVLSRNKRWFVFPKGGNVLLTMVMTKSIPDGMPRGLQESMEVEMGFPVPAWVEGWRPTPVLEIKEDSKIIQNSTVAQPKIDTGFLKHVWNNRRWHNYGNNRRIQGNPLKSGRQQYEYINAPLTSFRQYPSAYSMPSVFQKTNKKTSFHPSHHHREYRERRQIFERFEGLGQNLGINIKSCIMRAICEVKNGLLPKGESFIQDVARMIFTVPIDDEFEDDYTDSAKNNEINCVKKFSVTCPFSPMKFFVQNSPRAPANWIRKDLS